MRVFIACWVMVMLSVAGCDNGLYASKPKTEEIPMVDVKRALNIASTPAPAIKEETKKEYFASTKKIGRKGAPVFYKDFLKNPGRYEGQRVNIHGKVLQIDENNGETGLQLIITSKYDSVMVAYSGTVDVYQDDIVTVYGEVTGSVDGVNRMGAAMNWPAITAKYIVKVASGE